MLEKLFGNKKDVSLIANPFNMRYVQSIHMNMRKRLFSDELVFEATIYFKNGSTSGSQDITGTDFSDLFQKVMNFCENLG